MPHRPFLAILVVLGGAALRCLDATAGEQARQPAEPQQQAPPISRYQGPEPRKPAVLLALEWLERVQDPETGAWSLTGSHDRTRYADGSACENRCQATALALLALQGSGHTLTKGRFKKNVGKAWEFLRKQQKADGSIADADRRELFLTHAQCMFALCEIYGMTKDPVFEEPAKRAIAYAIKTQHSLGGWGASAAPDGASADTNTAVTCWMTTALQSARMARLDVPREVTAGVRRYLDRAETAEGRYRASAHPTSPETHALTAQGLLAREFLGWKHDDPRLVAGAGHLLAKLPSPDEPDVTYWYFATQVVHHMEGDYWTKWNSVTRDLIVGRQTQEGPEAGTWEPRKPKPDTLGSERGRLYVTCLSACILEVYYRHLPIYSKIVLPAE